MNMQPRSIRSMRRRTWHTRDVEERTWRTDTSDDRNIAGALHST